MRGALIAIAVVVAIPPARAEDTCAPAGVTADPVTVRLARTVTTSRWASVSPDGRTLALGGNDAVELWDLANGSPLWEAPGFDGNPRWSATGDRVLAVDRDLARTLDLALGDGASQIEHAVRLPIPRQSDVASAVLVAGGFELRDASDRKVRTLTWPAGAPGAIEEISVSPDGSRLVVLIKRADDLPETEPTTLLTWTMDGHGQALAVPSDYVWGVEAMPDAIALVTSGANPWIVPVDGGAPHPLEALAGASVLVASPDGKRLAFTSSATGVYDLASDTVLWQRPDGGVPAFTPDGRTLLLADKQVLRLDAGSGRERGRFGAGFVEQTPLLAADGHLVAKSSLGITSWDLARGAPEPDRSRAVPGASFSVRGEDLWVTNSDLVRTDDCRLTWRTDRWKGGAPPDDLEDRLAGGAGGLRLCIHGRLELFGTAGPRMVVLDGDEREIHDLEAKTVVSLPGSEDALDLVLVDGGTVYVDLHTNATQWMFWDDAGTAHPLVLPQPFPYLSTRAAVAVSASKRLAIAVERRLYFFDLPDGGNAHVVELDAAATAAVWRGDDLYLAFGDGTLRRLDRDGAEQARSVERGDTGLTHLILSAEEDRLITSEAGGAMRVWDPDTLAVQVALAQTDDGEWIALTPGGAIHGGADAASLASLRYASPAAAAPLGTLADTVRKPDIVRRRLAGKQADLALTAVRAPVVALRSSAVKDGVAGVDLEVASVSGAGEVHVFVEGRPAGRAAYCGAHASVHLDVPVPGAARITAVAFDTDGGTSASTTADVAAGAADERPALWAVVVGIGAYEHLGARWQLAAQHDARALAAALGDMAGDGLPYAEAHVTTLIDGDATRAAVQDALDALAQMKPGDLAVVYLAGHGWKIPDKGMVLLTSAVSSKRDAAKLGISWSSIRDRLEAAPGRVLVLLDACHSGGFSQDVVVPNEQLASSLARRGRSGVVVFAASKGRQFSYEVGASRGHFELAVTSAKVAPKKKPKKRPRVVPPPTTAAPTYDPAAPVGVFTSAVISAFLDPAVDGDQDGALQLSELVDDVTARVARETEGRQTPTVSRRELFGDFTIGPLLDQVE